MTSFAHKDTYHTFTKIDRSQIKLLWYNDFWMNEAVDGVLEYNGTRYWFSQCDDYEQHENMIHNHHKGETLDWHRRYTIHELTAEELTSLNDSHEKFKQHIGTHCDYNEDQTLTQEACKIDEEFEVKLMKYAESLGENLSDTEYWKNPMIGWFEK